MTGRFTVKVAERAAIQLETASEWWSRNRPKAPNAVEDDVAKALELLASRSRREVRERATSAASQAFPA